MTRKIENCNVCVVGGAGFLGSHLVEHLLYNRSCRVVVVDNLVVGRREFVPRQASFVHHDITGSEEFVRHLLQKECIDYVFNYAAWPYIPDSFARPLQVFSTNATGAIKVINAAQEAGCKGILQISSAEIYGDWVEQDSLIKAANRITEDVPVTPHSTYGAAKAAVDYYCQSAWRERGTPVIALRQFNCVGERETHPYVIPEIINQIHERGPRVELGNDSFRDFLYAGDQACMATELLEKGEFGEVYNLGSQEGVRIFELAHIIGRLMGHEDVEVVQKEERKRPWEIWHLQSDNAKIHSVVGSRPRVSLEDALARTIAYYAANDHTWGW